MIISGSLFIALLSGVAMHAKWIGNLDAWGNIVTFSTEEVRLFYMVASFFASPLVTCLIVLMLCGMIGIKTQWERGLTIGGMFLGGSALAFLIKEIVRRPRPRLTVDHGFSFPSGHVFVTTLLVLGILIYLGHYGQWLGSERRFGITLAMVCWEVVIILARIALHAHYLSDVLGSAFLGIWWVALGEFLWNVSSGAKQSHTEVK